MGKFLKRYSRVTTHIFFMSIFIVIGAVGIGLITIGYENDKWTMIATTVDGDGNKRTYVDGFEVSNLRTGANGNVTGLQYWDTAVFSGDTTPYTFSDDSDWGEAEIGDDIIKYHIGDSP